MIALQLVYLCTFGEKVVTVVQDINTKILESQTSNEVGLAVSVQLQNFHGFSADGFFTVNHSLLTGMANLTKPKLSKLIKVQKEASRVIWIPWIHSHDNYLSVLNCEISLTVKLK